MLTLGVHVSGAGKIYQAVDRAKNLGCNTLQMFARNPRQWRRAELERQDIKIFREKVRKAKIKPVVIHIPYTLNLASAKPHFYEITIREFIQDLREADALGAEYLVTHLGSHKGTTQEQGLDLVRQALKKILEATPEVKTQVLLENTAGSGCWLGKNFDHHKQIIDFANGSKRLGLCLDTAHAWAAGYVLNKPEGLEKMLGEIDSNIGLERLKVVHLNDTPEALGSLRDRHFDIGKGCIGKKGFSLILNHPRLRKSVFILETPKESDADDKRNLSAARKLYTNGVLKAS